MTAAYLQSASLTPVLSLSSVLAAVMQGWVEVSGPSILLLLLLLLGVAATVTGGGGDEEVEGGIRLVFRCCGRQLPDEPVQALLFLLPWLLFLDRQNSERAAGRGCSATEGEEGNERRGDGEGWLGGGDVLHLLNVLSCSANAPPSGHAGSLQRWERFLQKVLGMGGRTWTARQQPAPLITHTHTHTRSAVVSAAVTKHAGLRTPPLLRWSFMSLMSCDGHVRCGRRKGRGVRGGWKL